MCLPGWLKDFWHIQFSLLESAPCLELSLSKSPYKKYFASTFNVRMMSTRIAIVRVPYMVKQTPIRIMRVTWSPKKHFDMCITVEGRTHFDVFAINMLWVEGIYVILSHESTLHRRVTDHQRIPWDYQNHVPGIVLESRIMPDDYQLYNSGSEAYVGIP